MRSTYKVFACRELGLFTQESNHESPDHVTDATTGKNSVDVCHSRLRMREKLSQEMRHELTQIAFQPTSTQCLGKNDERLGNADSNFRTDDVARFGNH